MKYKKGAKCMIEKDKWPVKWDQKKKLPWALCPVKGSLLSCYAIVMNRMPQSVIGKVRHLINKANLKC